MKLSEAIRLGAMMKPQAFLQGFDGVGTCTLGAALDAIGRLHDQSFWPSMEWPVLRLAQGAQCPACGRLAGIGTDGTVPHLNDYHHWTREQIADWVETVEAQHEAAPQPMSTEVLV